MHIIQKVICEIDDRFFVFKIYCFIQFVYYLSYL